MDNIASDQAGQESETDAPSEEDVWWPEDDRSRGRWGLLRTALLVAVGALLILILLGFLRFWMVNSYGGI